MGCWCLEVPELYVIPEGSMVLSMITASCFSSLQGVNTNRVGHWLGVCCMIIYLTTKGHSL